MASFTNILVETQGKVGIITFNRPEALNALCEELMVELTSALDTFEQDDQIGCMVLTGSEKAFAAGADVKEMQPKSYMDVYKEDFITNGWQRLMSCRKPVIAAVSGYALGGGCEVAMMCDLIIASDTAKFGQPEINLGVMAGIGGTQRLPNTVGKSKAMDMHLTGRYMDAQEAERAGLVSRVFSEKDFPLKIVEIAKKISEKSMSSILSIKESINFSYEANLAAGINFERRKFHSLFSTEDQKEGMSAFVEKRTPKFTDR